MFYLTWIQEWWTAGYLKSWTLTRLLHICTFVPTKFKRNLTTDSKATSVSPVQHLTRNIPLQQYEKRCMHRRSPVPVAICTSVSELKITRHFWYSELKFYIEFVCMHIRNLPLIYLPIYIIDWCIKTHTRFCSFLPHVLLYYLLKQLSNCIRFNLASPRSFPPPLFSNFFPFF